MESLNRRNNCRNDLFAIQISLVKMHFDNHISISNLLSVLTEVRKRWISDVSASVTLSKCGIPQFMVVPTD